MVNCYYKNDKENCMLDLREFTQNEEELKILEYFRERAENYKDVSFRYQGETILFVPYIQWIQIWCQSKMVVKYKGIEEVFKKLKLNGKPFVSLLSEITHIR